MLAVLALTLVAQRPDMDFTPKWIEGDTWVARVTTKLQPDFPGDPVETYIFDETYTVASTKDGIRKVAVSRKLVESLLNQERLPPLPGQTAELYEVVWKGSESPVRDTLLRDNGLRRIWRMTSYTPPAQPIGMGKSWVVEFPAQPENALTKSTATWKLTGVSKFLERTTAKLQFSFKEANMTPPMTAEGDALVDHKTGILLEFKLKAWNAPAPFGDASGNNYTYEYVVSDLRLKPRE